MEWFNRENVISVLGSLIINLFGISLRKGEAVILYRNGKAVVALQSYKRYRMGQAALHVVERERESDAGDLWEPKMPKVKSLDDDSNTSSDALGQESNGEPGKEQGDESGNEQGIEPKNEGGNEPGDEPGNEPSHPCASRRPHGLKKSLSILIQEFRASDRIN